MANSVIKNSGLIKSKYPEVWEALDGHNESLNNIGQQTSAAPVGSNPSTQPHSKLTVLGGAGIYDIAMQDENPQYRGQENFVDYTTDPNWSSDNFHTIHVGASNNHRASLGPGKYYFRSYTQHPTTGPSAYTYHDGVVDGSGSSAPSMQPNAGSGTGDKGYGQDPFLSTNGQVPIR